MEPPQSSSKITSFFTREDDREAYGEQRLISLEWLRNRVVVLVWTDRGHDPHMISYREGETHEQEAYFRAFPKE